ncbi:MAG: tRNA lysidine(34) synthetase TilS [Chitinophagaceae bacterium]
MPQRDKLLLAVSGGLDSVVMLALCHQAGFDIRVAHCNFQLRGSESDRDEAFVRSLAEKYQVRVELKQFDTETYAKENKLSVQEAARELRYRWFGDLIAETGEYLLTAHHTDDNIETLLMHFFRGTGLHGLTGIPEKSGRIRRPLLSFTREQLASYATEQGLEFVEDSSNLSVKYTRNYFRQEILPALRTRYPQVSDNLADNIVRFRETEQLYRIATGRILDKLCRRKGNEVHVPVRQLMGYGSRALVYELIHPYGFTERQVDEVIRLADSPTGRYIPSAGSGYRVIRHRHWLIISPAAPETSAHIMIGKEDSLVKFAGGVLTLKTLSVGEAGMDPDPRVAYLDYRHIEYPLLLRKWKTGDYFYPLGMRKKKKVARFLIDAKLSKTQKEQVWVIESAGRIVWLAGFRIDDRFRITPGTRDILRLELR